MKQNKDGKKKKKIGKKENNLKYSVQKYCKPGG